MPVLPGIAWQTSEHDRETDYLSYPYKDTLTRNGPGIEGYTQTRSEQRSEQQYGYYARIVAV